MERKVFSYPLHWQILWVLLCAADFPEHGQLHFLWCATSAGLFPQKRYVYRRNRRVGIAVTFCFAIVSVGVLYCLSDLDKTRLQVLAWLCRTWQSVWL